MDIEFLDAAGVPLVVGPSGFAELPSEFVRPGNDDPIWRVRWLDRRRAPIYGSVSGSPVSLRDEDGLYLPPSKKDAKRLASRWRSEFGQSGPSLVQRQRSQSVGIVGLFRDDQLELPLQPGLLVTSDRLPAVEVKAMIEDLGALASSLSMYSWFTDAASGPGDTSARTTLDRIAVHAERAVELVDAMTRHRDEMWAARHDRLVRGVRPFTREAATRRGLLGPYVAASPRPGARLIRAVESDVRTPERERVECMARLVAERLRSLRRELDVRRAAVEEGRAEVSGEFVRPPRLDGGGIRASSANLASIIAGLDDSLAQLGVTFPASARVPIMPAASNRMLMERGFREVEAAWSTFATGRGRDEAELGDGVVRPNEISLAASPFLYERWVWMTVLDGLRRRGFVLEDTSQETFKSLTTHWLRHADLSAAARLELYHHSANVKVLLDFDSNVAVGTERWRARGRAVKDTTSHLTPDLWIEASTIRRTVHGILDAKYMQAGIHKEVEMVADHKYRETFLPEVSGIVHVAPNSVSWDRRGARQFESAAAPHTLLSMCLRPASEIDSMLTTFFRVLFGYHLDVYNVCWRCGVAGHEQEPTGYTHRWRCPDCSSEWRKSHCGSCRGGVRRSPLLKFGKESFHRVLANGSVECPHCGQGFVGA